VIRDHKAWFIADPSILCEAGSPHGDEEIALLDQRYVRRYSETYCAYNLIVPEFVDQHVKYLGFRLQSDWSIVYTLAMALIFLIAWPRYVVTINYKTSAGIYKKQSVHQTCIKAFQVSKTTVLYP